MVGDCFADRMTCQRDQEGCAEVVRCPNLGSLLMSLSTCLRRWLVIVYSARPPALCPDFE